MSEQITADQLERAAYHDNRTVATCHECGVSIDIEQDSYGQSIDGERYCCYDCREDFARLSTCHHPKYNRYSASARKYIDKKTMFDSEEVGAYHPNEHEALKRAAEMAELVWGVKSYCERG